MQKFCKDCRHYRMPDVPDAKAECHREASLNTDIVTGVTSPTGWRDCYMERYYTPEVKSDVFCGKEAKFFEPKTGLHPIYGKE